MEYRLLSNPDDYRAYLDAKERGEDVYLMKLGKGPLVIANMPEKPERLWKHVEYSADE